MAYFTYKHQKIHYRIIGKGTPLLLLHGNTLSSRMFGTVLKQYTREFRVILIDFPGHGKSERLKQFETDFWFSNAEVTFAVLEHLQLDKAGVIGTSGGALVAINLALEHPEKIKFLVADSFEGEYPLPSYIHTLRADRENDKKKLPAKLIWFYCHSFGWKKVVDADTKVNLDFAATGQSFFHRSIADLKVPALLTGSRKDEYCDHLDQIYRALQQKNKQLKVHLFDQGGHPAMLSNRDAFFRQIKQFSKPL